MTPQVTIITFTYNKPELFTECAASVLAQTYRDWVWWVVINAWEFPEGYTDIMSEHTFGNEAKFKHPLWDDPRIMLLWFPVNEDARRQSHVPAQIVNWLYPKVQTPYIYFLADDDLIDKHGLGVLVEDLSILGDHPDADAVYGRCEVVDQQPDLSFKPACWCYEGSDVGGDTGIDPHCLLDGGQVLHTKDLWDQATQCPTCAGSGQIIPHISLPKPCPDCSGTGKSWQLDDSRDGAASNDGLLLNRLAQFTRFHYVPQRIVTHRRTFQSHFHKPQSQEPR